MIAYHKARGIENNLSTIDKIVKYWKIDNIYIPKLYFHFDFLSFDCEEGFVENVILAVNTVNRIMDEYSEKQYPDENIVLRPQIIIRIDIDVLYPPPQRIATQALPSEKAGRYIADTQSFLNY